MLSLKLSNLKNSQEITDFFLDLLCSKGDVINIFLKNSLKLTGRIILYDKECILLARNGTHDIQLIRIDSVATFAPSENKISVKDIEEHLNVLDPVGLEISNDLEDMLRQTDE